MRRHRSENLAKVEVGSIVTFKMDYRDISNPCGIPGAFSSISRLRGRKKEVYVQKRMRAALYRGCVQAKTSCNSSCRCCEQCGNPHN